MSYITKEILKNFIKDSADYFQTSVATYLENRAHNNYVVLEGNKPVMWNDTTLMVLNSKALAEEEAKEYEKAKIMTEYDYYVSRGLFSDAV